jgi:simple sugar transport system permease protein
MLNMSPSKLPFPGWSSGKTAAKGFPHIKAIPEAAHLPKLFGVHIGWMIALLLTAFVAVYLKYTKRGYEIRVVGESERTAHYAGINVRHVLVSGVALSGAIVGLAGFIKLSGVSYMLSENIGGGSGFSAVIIAWLAQLNAPVMVLIALLFAAMEQGAMGMELALKIPVSVADIIKGLILFAALAAEFFIAYRIVVEKGPPARSRQTRRPSPSAKDISRTGEA